MERVQPGNDRNHLGGASKISSLAEDAVGKQARSDRSRFGEATEVALEKRQKKSSPAEDEVGSMRGSEVTLVEGQIQVHLLRTGAAGRGNALGNEREMRRRRTSERMRWNVAMTAQLLFFHCSVSLFLSLASL